MVKQRTTGTVQRGTGSRTVNSMQRKQLGLWDCATDGKVPGVIAAVGTTLNIFPQTAAAAKVFYAAAAWLLVLSKNNVC